MNNKTKELLQVLQDVDMHFGNAWASLNEERTVNKERNYLHRYESELSLLEDHIGVIKSSVNNLHLRVQREKSDNAWPPFCD